MGIGMGVRGEDRARVLCRCVANLVCLRYRKVMSSGMQVTFPTYE